MGERLMRVELVAGVCYALGFLSGTLVTLYLWRKK